ncbi:glycoside hydrolase family 20 zincin-like fold domain-containing protein [Streptosporangium lutulentum]
MRLALAVLDLRPAGSGAVTVEADASLGAEAYTLEVTAGGVRITAADPAGAFYAGQTLRQLLPPARSVRWPGRDGRFRTAGWRTRRGSPGAGSTWTWPGTSCPSARCSGWSTSWRRTS